MNKLTFIAIVISGLIVMSFRTGSPSEWERNIMERISQDQHLTLSAYLLDYKVIGKETDTASDTLILYLSASTNADTSSAEILLWELRCTKASNTASFSRKTYKGDCKEHGVVIPTEIRFGKYDPALGKAEVLCHNNHFFTFLLPPN